jgi:hypothetical protein
MVTDAAMTTRRDDKKPREVADQHSTDDPAVYAQLYAGADYLTPLGKAPTYVNGDEGARSCMISSTGLLVRDGHLVVMEGLIFRFQELG